MTKIIFPKLNSFIPIRALGLKQFKTYSNGPNCEKAMACLVNYNIKGFQRAVKKAVSAGENINGTTSNWETLYTCIAKLNNPYLLQKLLEATGPGVLDFKAPNLYGETFQVIIEEDLQALSVKTQETVEDVAAESTQQEKQVEHVLEQAVIEEAVKVPVEENKEMSLEILQEEQIEDAIPASESFGVALFNKFAVLNDQPPVLNDGYVDNMSVVEDILPMNGQVDMAGDQVENIAEQTVEKVYQKSLIFGSNF